MSADRNPSNPQSDPLSTRDQAAALRILDAEANRAGEGLRVIEDYVRFALDDRHLTEQCKTRRHELATALGEIDMAARLAARDTAHDVGATITAAREQSRASPADVAVASFKRVQQALRALEEYAKLIDGRLAGTLESLRYRLYTLERAVGVTGEAIERLAETRLYVLVDGRESEQALATITDALVAAGVDAIQLRDKRLGDRELLARALVVRQHTRDTSALFVMNDRPDLAVLAKADAVHVGQEELSVKAVRTIVGPQMLIGVSTHSIDQARQAVLDGANYIGVGPTFPSTTKSFDALSGVAFVRQVASEIRLPAFAIGGITPANVAEVVAAGLRRVAVGSAMLDAADPKQVAAQFKAALRES